MNTQKSNLKFDVFLSRKSEDIDMSMRIYKYLTAAGLKVFDASVSLPEMGISDYSKAIDLALDNCTNLVVVTSSSDHPSSSWVEAEWRFFLNKKRANKKKGNLLCVTTDNVEIEDLPPSLQNFEVVNENNLDRLLPYVNTKTASVADKHINESSTVTPPPKKVAPKQKTSTTINDPWYENLPIKKIGFASLGVVLLAFIGFQFMSSDSKNEAKINELLTKAYDHYKDNETREAFLIYKEAAELNSGRAYEALSTIHYEGVGVPIDVKLGKEYAEKAVEHGYIAGAFNIGFDYYKGKSGKVDTVKAKPYFEKAFEQIKKLAFEGDPECQNLYGLYYDYGFDVPRDQVKAADFYLKSANQGHPPAMSNIAHCYTSGYGVLKDYDKALSWLRKGEKLNLLRALHGLGNAYTNGFGVPLNDSIAHKYYNKAADLGYRGSYWSLGSQYYAGNGVEKDLEKAKWWYEKGAKKGDSDCLNSLGTMYQNGIGVEKNYNKARTYYLDAIDLNNSFSMNNLGILYELKDGFDDINKAREFYEQSAKIGYNTAIVNLARFYKQSKGGLKSNGPNALKWYKEAYKHERALNYNFSAASIAKLYHEGSKYVKPNKLLAAKWLEIASYSGSSESMEKLAHLYESGIGVEKDLELSELWKANSKVKGKKYKIPLIDENGKKVPNYIYVINKYPEGDNPLDFDQKILREVNNLEIPPEVVESFDKLYVIALENDVSFIELCEYALESEDKDSK